MNWDLSCPDWENRLRERRSLIPSLPLDQAAAQRAVNAFNLLKLADVPGTPTMEEAGGEWFRDIVRVVFGCIDPASRARFIRELFLLVPKKNSKTTNGALLMLLLLLFNERPRGQAIMTAPVKDVAKVAFDAIAGAIYLDPVLSKKLHVRDHIKTIVHRETKASLQVMTFDPEVLTGQKLFAALIDEIHVVAKMAKADRAIRQIRGGMIPFPEAFLAFITTQSEEAPSGVFKAELDTARDVRDGKNTETPMLPILYEFPEAMQKTEAWKDPANWDLVNPNLDRSIPLVRLVEGFRSAEAKGPADLRGWTSQHLNVEIGIALRSDDWAGAMLWDKNEEPDLVDLKTLMARCEVIELGIDGGGLDDLLGMAAVGREIETGRWLAWTKAWAHEIVLERRKEIAPKLLDLVAEGTLTLVDEVGDDIEEMIEIVKMIEEAGLLDQIGLDPHGVGEIVNALLLFLDEKRLVNVSQGWRLGGTIKTTERALAEKRLAHGGCSMMEWCVGNAKVEPRGNSILITKQVSGSAKIDPLMALFNAMALISLNPASKLHGYQMFVLGGRGASKS